MRFRLYRTVHAIFWNVVLSDIRCEDTLLSFYAIYGMEVRPYRAVVSLPWSVSAALRWKDSLPSCCMLYVEQRFWASSIWRTLSDINVSLLAHISIHTYIHTHIHTHIYINERKGRIWYQRESTFFHLCKYACMYVFMYVYVCMYADLCM